MQQTEKYKLNLIERDDAFSPDALNENTQKVEAAMIAHEAAVEEVTDALDARVKVFEAHKLAYGTYTGTGKAMKIDLGFTPEVVFVAAANLAYTSEGIAVRDVGIRYESSSLQIVENGFKAEGATAARSFCRSGIQYNYLALA